MKTKIIECTIRHYRERGVECIELTYVIDSFWRSVFGLKTEYRFYTSEDHRLTKQKQSIRDINNGIGFKFVWFDENNKNVTDWDTMYLISRIHESLKFKI